MKRAVLLFLLAAGCVADGEPTVPTKDDALQVTRLFRVDDCVVFRFFDTGFFRYIAKCQTSVAVSR